MKMDDENGIFELAKINPNYLMNGLNLSKTLVLQKIHR